MVVGFAFTLATSLGFDAVFFAGFGLAAVVVGAFGTIGTTVSTASVALGRGTPVREEVLEAPRRSDA